MALMDVSIGDGAPDIVNAIVEIPKGTSNKYEYDEGLGVIRLDRVLFSPVYYPAEYGFVPETRSPDGDHLDILVLISQPTFPGCVLEVAPVGILDMSDDAGDDWKIIAVAVGDTRMASIKTLDSVNGHMRREIEHFFRTYKDLEGKRVDVIGWRGREDAHQVIVDAHARFRGEAKTETRPSAKDAGAS